MPTYGKKKKRKRKKKRKGKHQAPSLTGGCGSSSDFAHLHN
jgi:hypothetical protein